MKIIILFFLFQILIFQKLNGIYIIKSLSNNYYFFLDGHTLILSKKQTNFRVISISSNLYYLEIKHSRKKIGVNDNNKIIKYNYEDKKKYNNKMVWNITKINEDEYLIKNNYNKKYIEIKDLFVQCCNKIFDLFNNSNEKLNNFKFKFVKLADEAKFEPKNLEIIRYHIILIY